MEKTSQINWYEWFLAGGVVMLFASFTLHHIINTPSINEKEGAFFSLLSDPWIEIEIYGAVEHPGRYRLPKGATLENLLEQAVPLEGAKLSKKKFKNPLKGGQKIEIVFEGTSLQKIPSTERPL